MVRTKRRSENTSDLVQELTDAGGPDGFAKPTGGVVLTEREESCSVDADPVAGRENPCARRGVASADCGQPGAGRDDPCSESGVMCPVDGFPRP